MLDACIGIVRTYIMIIQIYVTDLRLLQDEKQMLERRLASTEADLQQKLNSCQEVLPFFPWIHHEIS